MSVWLARATFFRRNKFLHAVAIRLGSVGGTPMCGCRFDGSAVVGAGSTAQLLEARFVTCVPRDVRTDFGMHHRCPIQMRLWLRLPGERCARCIDERPLLKFRSNMPSNSDWQGQATSTSVPHSDSPVSYRIRTCRTDVLLAVRSPTCCRTVMKYHCLSYCVLSW